MNWVTRTGATSTASEAVGRQEPWQPFLEEIDPETGWSLAAIARLRAFSDFLNAPAYKTQKIELNIGHMKAGTHRTCVGYIEVGAKRNATHGDVSISTISGLADIAELPHITADSTVGQFSSPLKDSNHHHACKQVIALLGKLTDQGNPNQLSTGGHPKYSAINIFVNRPGASDFKRSQPAPDDAFPVERAVLSNAITIPAHARTHILGSIQKLSTHMNECIEYCQAGDQAMAQMYRDEVFADIKKLGFNQADYEAMATLERMVAMANDIGKSRRIP